MTVAGMNAHHMPSPKPPWFLASLRMVPSETVSNGPRPIMLMAMAAILEKRVTEIAKATENQSVSLEQVNVAIGEMDRMTQQNAAMVEQSTAAARSLAEEARDLSEQVGRFHTDAPGSARASTPPTPKAMPRAVAPAAPRPAVRGNLALRADPIAADDDWSEF